MSAAVQAVLVRDAMRYRHSQAHVMFPCDCANCKGHAALDALVRRCDAAESFVAAYLSDNLTDELISEAIASRAAETTE